MANTNLPAQGAAGIAPPPDAPIETSQPLTADYFAEATTRARANERELAPLTYGRTATAAPITTGIVAASGEVQEPKPVQAAPGYVTPTPKSEFPAASNSDSPSRGLPGTAPVPAERTRAPLSVVGGFGEAEAEYFPLNGQELRTMVEQLLDELHARIQNDLRFHISATYPRLSVKLQLIVEGEADDQTQTIEHIKPPVDKIPLDVAQQHADSVVFVVKSYRREFDEAGNVETPADAMRDELGLRKPRKHQIKNGMGTAMIDVNW